MCALDCVCFFFLLSCCTRMHTNSLFFCVARVYSLTFRRGVCVKELVSDVIICARLKLRELTSKIGVMLYHAAATTI